MINTQIAPIFSQLSAAMGSSKREDENDWCPKAAEGCKKTAKCFEVLSLKCNEEITVNRNIGGQDKVYKNKETINPACRMAIKAVQSPCWTVKDLQEVMIDCSAVQLHLHNITLMEESTVEKLLQPQHKNQGHSDKPDGLLSQFLLKRTFLAAVVVFLVVFFANWKHFTGKRKNETHIRASVRKSQSWKGDVCK